LEEERLMQNKDGIQKGPQDHAEGQHGSKTHSKFLEQLHSTSNGAGKNGSNGGAPLPSDKNKAHHNSAHRLFEAREQHDEAEKNSEKTRLNREIERHHVPPGEPIENVVKVVPPQVLAKARPLEEVAKVIPPPKLEEILHPQKPAKIPPHSD
jgi:hypothetical protein